MALMPALFCTSFMAVIRLMEGARTRLGATPGVSSQRPGGHPTAWLDPNKEAFGGPEEPPVIWFGFCSGRKHQGIKIRMKETSLFAGTKSCFTAKISMFSSKETSGTKFKLMKVPVFEIHAAMFLKYITTCCCTDS